MDCLIKLASGGGKISYKHGVRGYLGRGQTTHHGIYWNQQ